MSKSIDIAKKFHERMATASGTRSDIRVTDQRALRDGSFKIALSYDKALSQPKVSDIKNYVSSKFDGKLVANLATARVHTEGRHHGITLIVTARRHTMKMEALRDKERFIPVVANTTFMDTTLKANWNVRTGPNGKQYIECAHEEDIAGLLSNAITASTRNDIGLRLGSETVASATMPEKGDVVKFFADNAQRTGTVSRIKGDEVYIAEEDGNTFVVPCVSVINIVEKNPKSAQRELNEQASFYAQFEPKEFVKEMFPGAKF
jgi:hypothetical protein